jgi:hypothetical protein
MQLQPTLAERIFKTLLRPGSETVERDRKASNAHFRHNTLPSVIATAVLIVAALGRAKSPSPSPQSGV